MRLTLFATLVLCCGATFATAQSAQWDYVGSRGPLNWGKLDPAYKACSDGHEQSPIDIRKARLNTALKPIEFHYIAGGATMVNTGHGIELRVHKGSYIVANGVRYDLEKVAFHHPSEDAVNGKLTDMDAQLIHKSADGKIAILVSRMNLDESHPNAMLATLWQHLPTQPGQTEEITDMVNARGLLPNDSGYWTYTGSLTEPPCTEGVQWFVMEKYVGINRAQLRAFSSLYRINSRPLQDRNGRKIEANK
ncbi:MAG: carbonic anhydrase family protein [Acidobacteriota bacterium]|nr:carbonic anhydrase family protein [Acidobacteriota bacterium]